VENDKLNELKETSTEIVVGGRKLYLRYSLNALAALEDEYGSMEAALNIDSKEPMMGKLRKLLFVGLRAIQPEITEDEVGETFTMADMEQFQTAIQEAVKTGLPEDTTTEGAVDENPLARHGKGKHKRG